MDSEKLTQCHDFTGQTVVMTGGTSVLGSEIACALAACGARLAILHQNPQHGRDLLARLGARAVNASLFPADLSQPEELRNAARQIADRFGKIDGLINAAGVSEHAQNSKRASGRLPGQEIAFRSVTGPR